MKKRIALAAVAALAGGLLVAAPASAAVPSTDVTFAVTNPANATAGAAATETATVVASTASVVNYVTWTNVDSVTAGGYVTVAGSTIISSTAGTVSGDATKVSFSATTAPVIKFLVPATLGSFTVTYTTAHDNGSSITYAVAQSLTVSVTAAPATAAYNHTVVGALGAFKDGVNAYTDAAGAAFVPAAIATVGVPETATSFSINQYSSTDTATLATPSLTKAVTVSLSGVGVLADGTNNNVTYLAYSAGTATGQKITVSRDGRSGVATISIAVDGTVVATRVVTFYGAVASFSLSIDHAQLAAGGTFIATVTKKDANGIAVPTAANWSVDTGTLGGTAYQYVPGTETRTVTYAGKSASIVTVGNNLVDTKTVVANFVTAGVKTLAVTADKASYAPGEKATFSFSLKNSDGVVSGDGNYVITWANSASIFSLPNNVDVKNGVGTITGYMPVTAGPVVISATIDAGTSTFNSSVVDPAATAQAAAITALQTSVATLTTTVASLVASMTAQIKVINATMLKIQKALAALAKKVK